MVRGNGQSGGMGHWGMGANVLLLMLASLVTVSCSFYQYHQHH